jgi:hypothetical protein
MRKLQSTVALLIFALMFGVLSGCASAPSAISAETSARIKTVGVISLAAQEFHRGYTGLTVFGNEYQAMDISKWAVDDEFEKQIVETVAALGGVKAVRVPTVRKDFLDVHLPSGPYEAPAFRAPRWSAIAEAIKAYSKANSVDAVIVIVRRITDDFLARTNQSFRGAGFYARGIGDRTGVSVLHLIATAGLLDGKTGEPLAVAIVSQSSNENEYARYTAQPIDHVAPELTRQPLPSVDSLEGQAIRKRLVELPALSWSPTIRKLFGK